MPHTAQATARTSQPAYDAKMGPHERPLTRDELILKHLPLTRAIASRVRENLPVQVELDDLTHAGVLGLFDAVKKYDPAKNVVFHLYAKHRIRGAILDSLRQLDWASRDLRKRYKTIENTAHQEAQKLGRAPEEAELAAAMGLSETIYRKHTSELKSAGLTAGQPHKVEKPEYTGYSEPIDLPERRPDQLFADNELRHVLDSVVDTLSPRYQKVIRMYYRQERTMKQIGAELGVNESRVSQIHKAALEKLGAALRIGGFGSSYEFLEDRRPA